MEWETSQSDIHGLFLLMPIPGDSLADWQISGI